MSPNIESSSNQGLTKYLFRQFSVTRNRFEEKKRKFEFKSRQVSSVSVFFYEIVSQENIFQMRFSEENSKIKSEMKWNDETETSKIDRFVKLNESANPNYVKLRQSISILNKITLFWIFYRNGPPQRNMMQNQRF